MGSPLVWRIGRYYCDVSDIAIHAYESLVNQPVVQTYYNIGKDKPKESVCQVPEGLDLKARINELLNNDIGYRNIHQRSNL